MILPPLRQRRAIDRNLSDFFRLGRALAGKPERDRAIERRMRAYYGERYGLALEFLQVPERALGRPEPFEFVPCAP